MPLELASLGSGSKGNATLIRSQSTCVLIDCGFSLTQSEKKIQRLGVLPVDINLILVTHEHSDHASGVQKLASKYNIPLVMTVGTARALSIVNFQAISGGQILNLGEDLCVQAVTVPHDSAEPVQFVFTQTGSQCKLGILTDSGHISRHIIEAYSGLNGLFLEFNYDEMMLQRGPYPEFLKKRIAGLYGHLSNAQSIDLLQRIDISRLNCMIAGHISEKNNSTEKVNTALERVTINSKPILATQKHGFDWYMIQ